MLKRIANRACIPTLRALKLKLLFRFLENQGKSETKMTRTVFPGVHCGGHPKAPNISSEGEQKAVMMITCSFEVGVL